MEACFDPATLTTLYTRHTLRGPTLKAAVQKIRVRPYKNVEKVYGNVNPEILYKKVKKREYIRGCKGVNLRLLVGRNSSIRGKIANITNK
jgi:hypothetical protein